MRLAAIRALLCMLALLAAASAVASLPLNAALQGRILRIITPQRLEVQVGSTRSQSRAWAHMVQQQSATGHKAWSTFSRAYNHAQRWCSGKKTHMAP